MPSRNSTMFSILAKLLCTPSPSSLCIKKSIKRTNYTTRSLSAHAWPEFKTVSKVARLLCTQSTSSLCKEKHKKDKLYYKKPPSKRLTPSSTMFSTMLFCCTRCTPSPSFLCTVQRHANRRKARWQLCGSELMRNVIILEQVSKQFKSHEKSPAAYL